MELLPRGKVLTGKRTVSPAPEGLPLKACP
jgi:hypothetical protein